MGYKPDWISDLPAGLSGPAGDLFEYGRDWTEEWLKEKLGIGQPEVFGGFSGTKYNDPGFQAARKEQ